MGQCAVYPDLGYSKTTATTIKNFQQKIFPTLFKQVILGINNLLWIQ